VINTIAKCAISRVYWAAPAPAPALAPVETVRPLLTAAVPSVPSACAADCADALSSEGLAEGGSSAVSGTSLGGAILFGRGLERTKPNRSNGQTISDIRECNSARGICTYRITRTLAVDGQCGQRGVRWRVLRCWLRCALCCAVRTVPKVFESTDRERLSPSTQQWPFGTLCSSLLHTTPRTAQHIDRHAIE
jgi:hypothetical protein